jgi:hypothetical protein
VQKSRSRGKIVVARGRGRKMEKAPEYVEKALGRIRENLEAKVSEYQGKFDAKLSGKGEFSIDTLEAVWGEILSENKKITEQMINEMVLESKEKDLIIKKNRK